jgi:hypothetical protein
MAKITLICDQPEHPWALEFQKSLACLGDHVELYHPESSIFAATDFVHFLIFDESPQFPWKNLLKSSLWGAWQKSKFIASFFECTEKSFHNPQVRWLLELCDLITLPSPDLLVRFHRMGLMDETLQLEIIPAQIFSLPEEMGSGKFQHEHKELEELLTRIQPYILIPLNFSSKFLKSQCEWSMSCAGFIFPIAESKLEEILGISFSKVWIKAFIFFLFMPSWEPQRLQGIIGKFQI